MNSFEYIRMMALQHLAELRTEAERSRLLSKAFKENSNSNRIDELLASIGKRLAALGNSLEARYGDQEEARATLKAQANPGGCG